MRPTYLFVILLIAGMPLIGHASIISYDMTDSGEGATLDEKETASVTKDGLTMSATANVSGTSGVMNATTNEFGINTDGDDASGFFDDAQGTEDLTFSFDKDRTLESIDFTSFGTNAAADLTVGGTTTRITSDDETNPFEVREFVPADTDIVLAFSADEGGDSWGIEEITTTPLPPALPAGVLALGLGYGVRRYRRARRGARGS